MSELVLRQEVLATLRAVAPEIDSEQVDPRRSFHDQLGIDSIDFLNFIVGLEERFAIRIAEPDYLQLSTLQGCLAYLRGHTGPREEVPIREGNSHETGS
jgi:acyl carrier protein